MHATATVVIGIGHSSSGHFVGQGGMTVKVGNFSHAVLGTSEQPPTLHHFVEVEVIQGIGIQLRITSQSQHVNVKPDHFLFPARCILNGSGHQETYSATGHCKMSNSHFAVGSAVTMGVAQIFLQDPEGHFETVTVVVGMMRVNWGSGAGAAATILYIFG